MRLALALVLVLVARSAHATYSIVAVDPSSRQVGGAGTSCIGTLSVRVIYGAVPGRGAVHAQAALGGSGKASAVTQLEMEIDPAAIIAAITTTAFDSNAQRRQYGIVDLQGRAAGFSGNQTMAFSDDRQAQVGAFTYSVQGNILTSAAVLDETAAAFEASGCDLADRLMRALEAGAQGGEGDSRCTPGGIPSDSAFLEVDRDGEPVGAFLRLEVTGTAPQNPLVALRSQYDAWRVTHPCPAPPGPDAGLDDEMMDGGGCGCSGSRSAEWPVVIVVAFWLRVRGRSVR